MSNVICFIGDRPRNLYLIYIECGFRGRKERTTSSQHGAYNLGNTHPTMANNNGKLAGNRMQISYKFRLSSDWGLQPDPMKSESVVIADQQAAVNTFSGLVHTARQANKVGGGRTPSFCALVPSFFVKEGEELKTV